MKLRKYAALTLALALLAGCGPKPPAPTPTPEPTPTVEATPMPEPTETPSLEHDEKVRVGLLKGATGLGAAKLMEDKKDSDTMEFSLMAEPTEAVAALTKGEVDMAALPTNLAATLYHKLDGGVQLLALNTPMGCFISWSGEIL